MGAPVSSFGFAAAVHPTHADAAWFVPAAADQQRVPRDAALVVDRTRDGGRAFETLRAGLPQADCYDLIYRHGLVVGSTGHNLMTGSTTGAPWASDDGGDRWAAVPVRLPPIYAVRFGWGRHRRSAAKRQAARGVHEFTTFYTDGTDGPHSGGCFVLRGVTECESCRSPV